MRKAITIRLSNDLAAWLESTAAKSGVSQGKLVRDQLEKARASNGAQAFMRWAGAVRGPKNLSKRKGFSRSLRALPIPASLSLSPIATIDTTAGL
jgi:hypothetical protein